MPVSRRSPRTAEGSKALDPTTHYRGDLGANKRKRRADEDDDDDQGKNPNRDDARR
jgi:hypothetical protein